MPNPVGRLPVPDLATAAARSIAASATQPQSGGAVAQASKEFVEICGFGRVKRADLDKDDAPPPWAQAWERQAVEGKASLLQRLASGSARQRITAAVLRADVQAAAGLAASSSDAAGYRIALRACRQDAAYRKTYPGLIAQRPAWVASGIVVPELLSPGPVPTACAALTLERLELLDPNDVWPWQARLQDAQHRADAAGVSQALYQFAQRARVAAPLRALSAALSEVAAPEPTPAEAMALVAVLGQDMAGMQSPHFDISRACRPEMLGDANRRQLCEQAVRRLPDMTTELIEAAMLHKLEERLGLPHGVKSVAEEEKTRLGEALAADSMRWLEEPSCAGLSGMGRQLVALSRQGELAFTRALVKSSQASVPR